METIKFNEPLESFLEKERIKTRFVKNFIKSYVGWKRKNIIKIALKFPSDNNIKSAFMRAFQWSKTDEGLKYWMEVEDKFFNYLKDNR